MGFKEVYKALLEIFPQVDSRVLRAVAIEHSNDADTAIDAVLVEIIPFFTEKSRQKCQSVGCMYVGESSKALMDDIPSGIGGLQQSFHGANDGHNEPFYDMHTGNQARDDWIPGLKLSEKCQRSSAKISTDMFCHIEPVTVIDRSGVNSNHLRTSADLEREGMISAGNRSESQIKPVSNQSPCHTPRTLEHMNVGVNPNMNLVPGLKEFDGLLGIDSNVPIHKENLQQKSCADGKSFEVDSHVEHPSFQDPTLSPTGSSVQLVEVPDVQEGNLEKLDECLSADATSKMEANYEMVGIEDKSTLNDSFYGSGQICVINLIEDIIADARNNKKTLFSAMESVIIMMKEVELKEKTAELAKMEAAEGGADILDRVEELGQMVKLAKEANEMQAGEIYGEKAVLCTELKELQSHVLSLSDERNESVATLHEMNQTLKMRLAAAENMIKFAEQEKVEKENSAHKALANQELVMEKVMQESKKSKQQAEENAKLREFLVDRGRVVDILQGEIAVIRQDVSLLKEKFDECVPFSKSLSSSQTSFILASSSSSSKTLFPHQVEPVPDQIDSLENPKKRDPEPCLDEQMSGKESVRDDTEERVDEEWEIF
ncbi:rab11 family-interacting 3 [Olea europaea subsp. europaea]|uniref:Rab11 family-interacting 3 n=3 Tax=Olea europaea subsp. europaea TaxID=158383 RepID=A0A8S0STV6_OLEEU|nr:rab11 family-interacting 3 [Olea europaea subsp. europaea]